ncbi:hypothetical protein [Salinibius halmophilus]|uniref:hypothetical protein n=1 Tax=Salinibius halmophilus TaxID=1853216 RepID=UPI000E667A83|nr:hypothetical protein [Salinibius halmophilus]
MSKREFTISTADDGSRYLHLSITDQALANGEQYRVPLAEMEPVLVTDAPDEWPLVVRPIKIQLTHDLDNLLAGKEKLGQRSTMCLPVRSGWLYLFKGGYLWRELRVEDGRYVDVNLAVHKGNNERPATCLSRDCIIVPASNDGEEFEIKAAFSEEQWSWRHINLLGGMCPDDPRNLENPQVSGITDSQLVEDRLCQLDVCDSLDEDETLKISTAAMQPYFNAEVPDEVAVYTLPDWLGYGYHISEKLALKVAHVRNEKNRLVNFQEIQSSQGASAADHFAKTKLAIEINQRYFYGLDHSIDQQPMQVKRFFDQDSGNDSFIGREEVQAYYREHYDEYEKLYGAGAGLRIQHELREEYKRLEEKHGAIKDRFEDLKKCREQVHDHQIRSILRATFFENEAEKISNLQTKFVDVVDHPSFVARFSDFAHLGSDEDPSLRFQGVAHLANMFEGVMHDVADITSGCAMDYAKIRSLQVANPLPDLVKKIIGSSPFKHPVYKYTFDIANLAPNLVQQFNQKLAEPLTIEAAEAMGLDEVEGIAELIRMVPAVKNPIDSEDQTTSEDSDSFNRGLAKQLCKIPLIFVLLHDYKKDNSIDRYLQEDSPLFYDKNEDIHRPPNDFDEAVMAQQQQEADLIDERIKLDDEIAKVEVEKAKVQQTISDYENRISKHNNELRRARLDVVDAVEEARQSTIQAQIKQTRAYKLEAERELSTLNIQESELKHQRTRVELYGHEQAAATRQMRSRAARQAASNTNIGVEPLGDDLVGANKKLARFQNMLYGSQTMQVEVSVVQILDGDFPATLAPANLSNFHKRLQTDINSLNELLSAEGPKFRFKTSSGITLSVPLSSWKSNRSNMQRLLNEYGAVIADLGEQDITSELQSKKLSLYFNKVEVDLPQEQLDQIVEARNKLNALRQEVKGAHKSLEIARQQQNLKYTELKRVQDQLDATVDSSLLAQQELINKQLDQIESTRYPALVQDIEPSVPFRRVAFAANTGMFIFNITFAIDKYKSLVELRSVRATVEFIAALADLFDSAIAVFELGLRSWKATGAPLLTRFQNLAPNTKLAIKSVSKGLGILGGVATFVQGAFDYFDATKSNDSAMLVSGLTCMIAGALSVVAILATGPLALVLGILAIGFAIASAVAALFALSDEEKILAHTPFGVLHHRLAPQTYTSYSYYTGSVTTTTVNPNDEYQHYEEPEVALQNFVSFTSAPQLTMKSAASGLYIYLPSSANTTIASYCYRVLVRAKDFYMQDAQEEWRTLIDDGVINSGGCFGINSEELNPLFTLEQGQQSKLYLSNLLFKKLNEGAKLQLNDSFDTFEIRLVCRSESLESDDEQSFNALGLSNQLPTAPTKVPNNYSPTSNVIEYAGQKFAKFNQVWWYASEEEYDYT